MRSIEVYKPGHTSYKAMSKLTGRGKETWLDYDAIAAKYNSAEIGTILVVGDHKTRPQNVKAILERRNIYPGIDCVVSRPIKDGEGKSLPMEERRILIKKLTSSEMTKHD